MSPAGVSALKLDDVSPYYGSPYPLDFYPDEFRQTMAASLDEAKKTECVVTQEASLVNLDGDELWYHSTIVPVKDEGGDVDFFLVVSLDTTERKQAELALAAEKERLAVTLRSIGDGVIATDTRGQIVMLNKVAETLTGWTSEEATGRSFSDVFNIIQEVTRRPCANIVETVISSGNMVKSTHHTCLIAKGGQEMIIADSGAPIYDKQGVIIGVVIVFRDMTEKKRLEESLQRSQQQKLESIGTLAGGIAHDFNNLLGGVFGFIELALRETTEENVASCLTESLDSVDRARGLTQQLLTFSEGGAPIKKVDALFPFVQETIEFALSELSCSSRFHIEEGLWPCDYDKTQMRQVIDHLILNADQAMPMGGEIVVTAQNITSPSSAHASLPEGPYVKLSIQDQGDGITKAFLTRIFDPYYTTKFHGHGMGLSTCYSIIKRHGGSIDVESELGKGSTFHVLLPALIQLELPRIELSSKAHSGKGTFLVMDDEDAIRSILKRMLESLGYQVVLTENGAEAVDFFRAEMKAGRKLAGALFDLTIPSGMGGKDAIGEIRKFCSETPVFVASGYSGDPVMAYPEEYGFNASMCKPFRMADLSAMLEQYMVELA